MKVTHLPRFCTTSFSAPWTVLRVMTLRPLSLSVLLTLPLVLFGCSGSKKGTSHTFPLPTRNLDSITNCSLSSKSGSNPAVYRCAGEKGSQDGAREVPLFVTIVEDCSIPEKFSHQATTRQLLIGITDLQVLNQEPVDLSGAKVLRSVVTGLLGVDRIIMATFTVRNEECVKDLVVWQNHGSLTAPGVASPGVVSPVDIFKDRSTVLAGRLAADVFDNSSISPSSTLPLQGLNDAAG